jgi:PTH1 family peptidyl-tRNA hydrolase
VVELIVGLGNPGPRYADTRHNAGFWFVDRLAAAEHLTLKAENRFHGEVATWQRSHGDVRLLKPLIFMNDSGRAVQALAAYYRIPVEHILVVHDELDLPPGQARLKLGGSAAGHNGLKDIQAQLGDAGFWRLRLGIGHPGDRTEVIDYVLRRAPAAEEALIHGAVAAAVDALPRLLEDGAAKVMNTLHRREPAP